MILVESASVNAQDNAGWTPLHEACSSCNSEMAELLLHNGADANISSRDGTRYARVCQEHLEQNLEPTDTEEHIKN